MTRMHSRGQVGGGGQEEEEGGVRRGITRIQSQGHGVTVGGGGGGGGREAAMQVQQIRKLRDVARAEAAGWKLDAGVRSESDVEGAGYGSWGSSVEGSVYKRAKTFRP